LASGPCRHPTGPAGCASSRGSCSDERPPP
jgi:hypothetical protein